MRFHGYKTAELILIGVFCCAAATAAAGQQKQKQRSQEKTVWNYDGGIFFETDGTLPNGICFRISGRMTSPDFFDHLRRVDTEAGTIFQRGTERVAQFPESVTVSFSIHDQLCPGGVQQVVTRHYLTQEMMDSLRVSVYWKHGVDLRPAKNIRVTGANVERLVPYAASLAAELPRRYEWSYQFAVPSAGVSLSDGLAFVFRVGDGRIAARVGARL